MTTRRPTLALIAAVARNGVIGRDNQNRIRWGNLLTLPVAGGLLYIEPLYVQGQSQPFPILQFVLVAFGDRVAFVERDYAAVVAAETTEHALPAGEGLVALRAGDVGPREAEQREQSALHPLPRLTDADVGSEHRASHDDGQHPAEDDGRQGGGDRPRQRGSGQCDEIAGGGRICAHGGVDITGGDQRDQDLQDE